MSNTDINQAIESARKLLASEQGLSPAFKSAMEIMFIAVSILLSRLTLNSSNSSKPPSSDPNRKKKRKGKGLQRGGQVGHVGTTLKQFEEVDEVMELKVDRRSLPSGKLTHAGYEKRQVVDIEFRRVVTEFRAEVLVDSNDKRYVACFPDGVTRPIQYGKGLKTYAVYMSQYQLIPYDRVQACIRDQLGIPISAGTISNFNQVASQKLADWDFEPWLQKKLARASVMHADETGINIDGKRHWLHCNSNRELTYFYPHAKRGCEAMDEMAVLPSFTGVLCHDHWKPYYRYDCTHALCNAHHLRELERAWEQDAQQWAKLVQDLLCEINTVVQDMGGRLVAETNEAFRKKYRALLLKADVECPPPDEGKRNGKRGRLKRSKSRNLLERLRTYEDDVLRFMEIEDVPFTNNQAENDVRMTKVHQKISGCFRSQEGAKCFSRCRSYISTCRKQGVSASDALRMLFDDKKPSFMLGAE